MTVLSYGLHVHNFCSKGEPTHIIQKGSTSEHLCQINFNFGKWFLRRRFLNFLKIWMVSPYQGETVMHDEIRNRNVLMIRALCKFDSNQIKKETSVVQTKQRLPVLLLSECKHSNAWWEISRKELRSTHDTSFYASLVQLK